ncbi:cyd operon protein YbgE [uncultured Actinobacillus sp.]|uniref:cyd operon protein YbgE n=1 Tax=uncultured Actinobacillus sp. TaxID=417616 RepID=UPI0025E0A45B|nr:cyd operon protein YbgE [uncultured Actinobacillus sp.]
MINSLYSLTRKGWLQALSFILALGMFIAILMYSNVFAHHFGGKIPYLALLVFYGMAILMIHAVGFDIKSLLWKCIFMPFLGYVIIISALIMLVLNK